MNNETTNSVLTGQGGERYPTSNPGQYDNGQMGGPYPSGMPGMYPSGPYPMQPYPARPDMGQGGYNDPYYGGGGGGGAAAGGYPDNRYNPVYDNRLPDDRQYMDRRPPPAAGPYPYDNKMPNQPNVPQMYPDQRYPPNRGYPAKQYPDRGGKTINLYSYYRCK